MKINRLVLASQSPFRKGLLASTGLEFSTATSKVDEKKITDQDPRRQALARALAKAKAVAQTHPDTLVIGADQVLADENQLLDKAESAAEAERTLTMLSGKTHYLHSAFCLVSASGVLHEEVVSVGMVMRDLTPDEIRCYVATGEWQGCVGCYRYEEKGIHLMREIKGSHSAIIGLPLLELLAALRKLGINPLLESRGPWTLDPSLCSG